MKDDNEKALVPQQVLALTKINAIEVSATVERLYSGMDTAADAIIATASSNELSRATDALLGVQTQVSAMKPTRGRIGKWLSSITKDVVAFTDHRIKHLQGVKVLLEERQAEYKLRRDALRTGYETVCGHRDEMLVIVDDMENMASQLVSEIEILRYYQSNFDKDEDTSSQVTADVIGAITVRQSVLADLQGAKVVMEGLIVDAELSVRDREALYLKFGSLIPIVDTLNKRQLANLISRGPSRKATETIKKATKDLRELTIAVSGETRKNAIAAAEAANSPILDEVTLEKVTENIVETCNEIRAIISESVATRDNVTKKAQDSSQKIKNRLIAFREGK